LQLSHPAAGGKKIVKNGIFLINIRYSADGIITVELAMAKNVYLYPGDTDYTPAVSSVFWL